MDANADALALALAALVRRQLGELGAAIPHDLEATIEAAMPSLLEADPVDEEGSLSRADLYRIRSGKLVARLLPLGALADRRRRRELRVSVRTIIGDHLGGLLPASVYLDGRRD